MAVLALVGVLAILGGCIKTTKLPTQRALHHAAALQDPQTDRIEGHLAGLERDLAELSSYRNHVPEADQERFVAAMPSIAPYLMDQRARVRVSSSRILLSILRMRAHPDSPGAPCDPIATVLLPDTSWIEGEFPRTAILANELPEDVSNRLSLLRACRGRPEVHALASRLLDDARIAEAAETSGYPSAAYVRDLARDLLTGQQRAGRPDDDGVRRPPSY